MRSHSSHSNAFEPIEPHSVIGSAANSNVRTPGFEVRFLPDFEGGELEATDLSNGLNAYS